MDYDALREEYGEKLYQLHAKLIAAQCAARHGGKPMAAIRFQRAAQYTKGAIGYLTDVR